MRLSTNSWPKRQRSSRRQPELTCLSALHEEISDVENCVDVLVDAGKIDMTIINDLKKRKMKRWERRINEARKNNCKS